MKTYKQWTNSSAWLAALFATLLLTACGGGTWDSNPTGGIDPDIDLPASPTVMVNNPGLNATGVAVTSAVNATFSVPMDADSINTDTFTLSSPENPSVDGAVTYSATGMTATFVPAANLDYGTTYTAAISADAESGAGAGLATAYSWSFTTEEEELVFIEVTDTNPLNEGTEVCTNKLVTATFDMPMDPATIESPALSFVLVETLNGTEIDGEVSLDEAGTTATFTPDSPLTANIEYTATVSTEATDENGNALEEAMEWSFTTNDAICQDVITLGSTIPYGVLSGASVTLGGAGLRVDGNVGIDPANACNGCDATTVSGDINVGNDLAIQAMIDLETAYEEALNRSTSRCTLIASGDLVSNPSATCGGAADGVYTPGLYWSGTSIEIPTGGTITLDAQNNSDAVFIFQSESTLNTLADSHVLLINGAQAKNVFWVAASSATIGGPEADFAGTILALISVTVSLGTEMEGRAFARTAAVVVEDGALITVPAE